MSPVFWGKAFASAAQIKILRAPWLAELLELVVTVHKSLSVTCILGKDFCFCSLNRLLLAAWLAELLKLEVTVHTILIAKCASEEKTNVMHWKRARIVF